jgi:hypothetical protein
MNPPNPLRPGEPAQTLPCSGDDLVGRCNAVFRDAVGRRFYRVKFGLISPYFPAGDGVIYREHEVTSVTAPVAPPVKTKLPKRPKPFSTQ